MSEKLSGRTAVITGSTSGIGRAMALRFACEGHSVVIHGTNAARAAAVVEQITHSGGRAAACLGDVADDAFAAELASFAGIILDRWTSWWLMPGWSRSNRSWI